MTCLATDVNEEMKLAAAYAIADMIDDTVLTPDYVIPSVFNQGVVDAVEAAVIEAARETGVARK